jgi:hypothetical protein
LPRAKLSKQERGRLQIEAGGVTADEVFTYLSERFRKARKHDDRTAIALQLLPFVKPKLKSVDVNQVATVRVRVTIGGDDD